MQLLLYSLPEAPGLSADLLELIALEPRGPVSASIIWLHGLGADGHDFEPIVPELQLNDLAIRYIFPHAPHRPVTINDGEEMRAWYDFIPHKEESRNEDIEASAGEIRALIEREISRGLPSERILLAGFSQGGVIALHTGLRLTKRLAGVIALSTYLHDPVGTEDEREDANLALPIFMAHGVGDQMIPVMRAAGSRENLIRMGYDMTWRDYPMGHAVCQEEIRDLARFIRQCLGAAGPD